MGADGLLERVGRVLEPVVDHHVAELALGPELLARRREPRGDLLGRVGAAADEPGAQRLLATAGR